MYRDKEQQAKANCQNCFAGVCARNRTQADERDSMVDQGNKTMKRSNPNRYQFARLFVRRFLDVLAFHDIAAFAARRETGCKTFREDKPKMRGTLRWLLAFQQNGPAKAAAPSTTMKPGCLA